MNPVRLKTLREFGSPEFVADKLIQAERRKVIEVDPSNAVLDAIFKVVLSN